MLTQENAHDNNVTEAQIAVIKAVTPLILEMSKEERGTRIIGNPNLQDNLRAGLALLPKPVVKKPTLVFVKQTLLGTTPVTVYGLDKQQRIADMLRAFLTLAPDASLDEVEKLLKEHKHPISDVEADEMLDKQAKFFRKEEGGKDFGLRGDGWANLILVINATGSVSVVYARWCGGGWSRYRSSLDDGNVWSVGRHLVLSNSSDTSSI